jgi:hypothetical protein
MLIDTDRNDKIENGRQRVGEGKAGDNLDIISRHPEPGQNM